METGKVEVNYLYGINRTDFLELNDFGFETNIPFEKEKPDKYASYKPEDYLIIYGIYFSIKIVEELAKGSAEKLISNFSKVIKNIWVKFKDAKPRLMVSSKEPVPKLPKAILTFQISENEKTTLEITNEINESELEKILDTQLELVKMKYEHRKAELKLENKMKLKK